ncbi:hypothetical protein [Acinetobacter amyesii]|uniref:hypothetical protein n=1 Tax=Acinetobacter amyesii TaxID=2942470 RepID=UPI0020BDB43B|nr:hypothetical protein [Acinetobacter amyesii]MCL6241072.1 hypothetical protein [Acinetobacter amyesii]
MARRKKSKAKKRNKSIKQQPIIIINEAPKSSPFWTVLLVPIFSWIKEIIQKFWS